MKITKLSWAGLILESGNTTLYIDPLQNIDVIAPFVGDAKFPALPVPYPKAGTANVLITHIHADHFDEKLLKQLLADKGLLWGPEAVRKSAANIGLRASIARLYDTFYVGDFKVTPVPAVDWVGEDQVSYVISDGEQTIFHGGDTNWHGYWWTIAERFGPFDAAFLPVNGVVGSLPGQDLISDMSGTMNPEQAVTAARILKAGYLVPIHYAQFDNPPTYTEFPEVEKTLESAGFKQRVIIRRLADGDII
ncbi:MBL fold metallo-hydrolase [Mucilaginibacter gossypii]|uniref:L-ascorbate metabolism protein UlaG, beta-lactamase superfamily n=1 Tax=Mucilaginibacter gossypii TaxID=551996 RepID=A0A1G8A9Z8_9SPHI|nr:MBL fold metallo-hydrolase [Mucilaginibacter gossypii]SDH17845.1 L-ascorbate metabolism protein UlaG, beta-lactamase superfamily [Mucilaginibacter gossypii]